MNGIEIDKKFFDSTYPLTTRFREVAPGSFDHCQNVEIIAEAVALDLDLNVDLLKCCARFHDIGKINSPLNFSENQDPDTNIHDNLDPYTSYSIITKHVGDGVVILLAEKDMPREVIEIISQHHGNCLTSFHDKAKDEPEDKYRYKCSKPESTEALVLIMVDQIEAMTKSKLNKRKPNKGKGKEKSNGDIIIECVNKIAKALEDDGQLDQMTIGTARVVKQAITKKLETMYHKRVPYPEDDNSDNDEDEASEDDTPSEATETKTEK